MLRNECKNTALDYGLQAFVRYKYGCRIHAAVTLQRNVVVSRSPCTPIRKKRKRWTG